MHNFFLEKMCSYISLKNHTPIDQIVNVSDKIKLRMSFFTDYDDVFSHYVNFVIDTTQVLGDLLQKKVAKLCWVEFPDSDAVFRYIQDAYVGGLCNNLPNLAKGLFSL